ncbi:MAG: 4-alpha-glucanotransferase [Verrucomicrobiales bacterium]|nr:4-alpha-glucanotransferase [Verrucomicrobiales bacterium]
MKLTFRLRFHTKVGQSLFITGNHEQLGGGQIKRAVPLQYLNEESWQASILLPDGAASDAAITYNYILHNADGSTVQDWGNDRVINPASFKQGEVLIVDSWNHAGAVENVFYTEPFKNVLLQANHTELRVPAPLGATHTFKVKAPLLQKGQTLCILGNGAALGNWIPDAPLLLNRIAGEDFLSVQLDLGRESFPVSYKYGVYDVERGNFIRFEEGDNRLLHDAVAPGKHTVVNDGFIRLPADTWKGAGVAIPVFSLRSENSFGTGEFTDLKPLADWCQRTGLKLIQILPVNDTSATHTWVDSYPYAAISAFALHPLCLNLNSLIAGKKKSLPKTLEAERKRLNALDTVDYEAVMQAKIKFVRTTFPKQKAKTFASRDYQEFFGQNKHWLEPYAAFCAFRDKFGTADFSQWPAHRVYRATEIAALVKKDPAIGDEIELNYFIQFHLHLQLQEAAGYVHAKGLILKGDIAIGVYRHGADIWQQPELFHADMQAGAPPDAFSAKGQNWGLPTYNWPRMMQDGFAWWKQRFAQMSCYFDAFRIDHILGFFRIWSSPAHAVEGIMGYFVPAIPVKLAEFSQHGIHFNHDRYVKPFITDPVLEEIFGAESATVRRDFLVADRPGHYFLKLEFATQRQVEKHFTALEASEPNRKLKEGLFNLISNVILFEAENSSGREFHFRFAMEDTLSFKNLDPQTRAKLKELYVDYFFRRQDDFWMQEGLQKLPALKRVTNMLICGEDLGLVPPCVPELMKELGLLSLEIQRMPKAMGVDFFRPADAPYLSVVTPSTHDMSTIRGWWEEDRNLAQKFYHQELKQAGAAPVHCDAEINKAIVLQHLASPAMWSIFQIQDLLGMDEQLRRTDFAAERINVPANPKHYWRYRMHLTLEKLLQAETFNNELNRQVLQNKR